jgi:glyceraldehyde-3-phosphate dehydrogenase/erythrose-4-phosphate dehydrogenase
VRVLVAGAGNIGTTLANVLLAHRRLLGIGEVVVRKIRETRPFDAPELEALQRLGARVVFAPTDASARDLLASVDYVFDCRREGAALRDRDLYLGLPNLRGVSAQGSETGFGVPFVSGVNAAAVGGERLVQIASCNTHATATLLRTLGGARLENLEEADLVCVRRSEDLGSHGRMVGANVVSRHRDARHGTHHAEDAARVYATLGLAPVVTSSDITTPSQLMHTVRFNVRLRAARAAREIVAAFKAEPRLATTAKLDSNRVFELGRRYGFQGRLFAHAIVVAHDLLVHGATVKGWAFVPQEGNTLLSTVEAFLLQTGHERAAEVGRALRENLVKRAV